MTTASQKPDTNPIVQQADGFQARASNPDISSWVSANAGSGKTHVLVNRIIRLLLADNAPQRILCLTYTRAAAAGMEDRLFERLSGWINLSDDDLAEQIAGLNAQSAWGGDLRAARRLFTRALETPGGLKIQTIHAFCESVLQRFPIEAKVSPGFTILDDRTASDWLAEVRQSVLTSAALAPDSLRGKALLSISGMMHADRFDDVLNTLLNQRSEIVSAWTDLEKGPVAQTALRGVLGIAEGDTLESICSDALSTIPVNQMKEACAALRLGSTNDQKSAARIDAYLKADNDLEKWEFLTACFYTGNKSALFAATSLITKKTADAHPGLKDSLLDIQQTVADAEDLRRSFITWHASNALFTLASEILNVFQNEKKRRGQLDYTDLVLYTRDLLTSTDNAWIMYRLDNGIDHVLIDEAQDTSPHQWEIFTALTEDFFTGHGARSAIERTVFAVGDRKQSIYSFQGADPEGFDVQRTYTAQRSNDAGKPFEPVNLNVSFRSTQTVLSAVDLVFSENPLAACGVAEKDQPWPEHQSTRNDMPGLVELWPLIERAETVEIDPYAPVDSTPNTHHHILLAQDIAARISHWLVQSDGENQHSVAPGDILILVRSRGILADALVRALTDKNVPVAGADRLVLNNHIAVMDLLALARAITTPHDDYSLACVLKSPLVGRDCTTETNDGTPPSPFDDGDLFDLANDRPGNLWSALANAGEPFLQASERLHRWRKLSQKLRPFEFFSYVLGPDHGRRWFHKRLGNEADDPIDEFLRLAFEYEASHAPSLSGFSEWLAGDEANIKREMDQGRNEVRVMTVHGAKGLESNIVILPDTTGVPDERKVDAIIGLGDKSAGGHILPVWKLKKELRPEIVAAYVEKELATRTEEENRLLYVAMTRARDALYVCGSGNAEKLKEACWYSKIQTMIETHGSLINDETGNPVWRMGTAGQTQASQEKAAQTPETSGNIEIKEWMRAPAPPEPPEPRPLAPSRLDFIAAGDDGPQAQLKEQPAQSPLVGADEARFLRGKLIHRLLQTLPDLPADERPAAMDRYLDVSTCDQAPDFAAGIKNEVIALLESTDPDFQALFAPGSMAEVPVTGRIGVKGPTGAPIVISGIIDRLKITDDEIILADFKTNRSPPHTIEAVSRLYIRQLAAYALALGEIYPKRRISAWLIWTEDAKPMCIPEELLDLAFT